MLPGGTVVRRARPDEAGPAAEVWLASRRAAFPAVPAPTHDDADVRRWFAGVVFGGGREVWVAEGGGALVAVLVLRDTWLEQLYVAPGHTGRGVGSALLGVAKSGRPFLQLWAFQSNVGARRFYERHGFVAVETTEGDNEEGEPDVRYQWREEARS